MIYKSILKPQVIDLLGGTYSDIDQNIYYITADDIYRVQLNQTTLISSNTTSSIIFGTSGTKLDIDNNKLEDIIIIYNTAKTTLEIGGDNETKMATPNTWDIDPSPFPISNQKIDTILSKPIQFLPKYYARNDLKPANFFLSQSGGGNYTIGEISTSLGPPWSLKYQTWSVFGQSSKWGGYGGSMGLKHTRMTGLGGSSSASVIIGEVDTSGADSRLNRYDRSLSSPGVFFGKFQKASDATQIDDCGAPVALGQMSVYGDFVFYIAGTDIRVMRLFDTTFSAHNIKITGGSLTAPIGLLVRADPRLPKEDATKLQIVVSDGWSLTKPSYDLRLLSISIGDVTKPLNGTLTAIAMGNDPSTGSTYKANDFWELTWANEERTAFYMPEPSGRKITRVAITPDGSSASIELIYESIPFPRTVLVASPTHLYVICKNQIGEIRISPKWDLNFPVLGIGFIPFMVKDGGKDTPIINETTGLANTSNLANWPLHVQNLPFGDSLSLMINHARLHDAGVRWYRVYFTDDSGRSYAVDNVFTDLRNGSPMGTSPSIGKYPIRADPTEWYFPHLGAVIDTRQVLNNSGLFNLHVDFYETAEDSKEILSFRHKIRIDNRSPKAKMHNPVIDIDKTKGTEELTDCGSLAYFDSNKDTLSVAYELEEADIYYSVTTQRGNAWVTGPGVTTSGKTTAAKTVGKLTGPVKNFLGDMCKAALIIFRASLSIPVTNGYQAYSHGSTDAVAFALYKEEPPGP